jgi:hypothetical protein
MNALIQHVKKKNPVTLQNIFNDNFILFEWSRKYTAFWWTSKTNICDIFVKMFVKTMTATTEKNRQ